MDPDIESDPHDIDPALIDWKGTAENLQQEVTRLTKAQVNTPEVRQAIATVIRDALGHPFEDVAAEAAGRVYVVLDRASAGRPLDVA